MNLEVSILAQRRDPEQYPEITHLADSYEKGRIYREWAFGRNTVFREPQRADMRSDRLEEDFSNLGLFLSRLRNVPMAKKAILAGLRDLYEGLTDFEVPITGGNVQIFFHEGDFSIPATRLSDGTLRYLCLLAILCDPEPPPLICLEEPELGLHPAYAQAGGPARGSFAADATDCDHPLRYFGGRHDGDTGGGGRMRETRRTDGDEAAA